MGIFDQYVLMLGRKLSNIYAINMRSVQRIILM